MNLSKLAVERLTCLRCNAIPGDPCWTRTGNRVHGAPHAERTTVLFDVWRDGYHEGESERDAWRQEARSARRELHELRTTLAALAKGGDQ